MTRIAFPLIEKSIKAFSIAFKHHPHEWTVRLLLQGWAHGLCKHLLGGSDVLKRERERFGRLVVSYFSLIERRRNYRQWMPEQSWSIVADRCWRGKTSLSYRSGVVGTLLAQFTHRSTKCLCRRRRHRSTTRIFDFQLVWCRRREKFCYKYHTQRSYRVELSRRRKRQACIRRLFSFLLPLLLNQAYSQVHAIVPFDFELFYWMLRELNDRKYLSDRN